MTKTELIAAICARLDTCTRAEAGRCVDAILGTLSENLTRGEMVTLPGFGSFRIVQRFGRWRRNPRTGEQIYVSTFRTVKFSATKALKDCVNDRA